MFNFIHRLCNSRKSPKSSPRHRNNEARELESVQLELSRALDSLSKLQVKLAEHDIILTVRTTGDPVLPPPPYELQPPFIASHSTIASRSCEKSIWINDIWLCSNRDSLLSEAENQWRNNRPDLAQESALRLINQNPLISKFDLIQLNLFVAAIQCSLGEHANSLESLGIVEELNGSYEVLYAPDSVTSTGIVDFIRGKTLMGMKKYVEAYWSFARVSDSPGYEEKSLEYQTATILHFTNVEAAEFGSSPTASTCALFHWNNSD